MVATNAFMWGAAAHAAYIAVVPALLRAGVARRNASRAMVRARRAIPWRPAPACPPCFVS